MENLDKLLGRVVMRSFALLAFIGSVASIGFGVVVISTALVPGVLLVLLGIGFIWLGKKAWRDRSGLGEILSRDYNSDTK